MASDPYTIRIFVPDGDPEGVRIIDRMNWTGKGIVFPREKWPDTRRRIELENPGVYILVGYDDPDGDLATIYVGEGDGIRDRIDSHHRNKDFWSVGIAFVSGNRSLNKAHVQWLEFALIDQAKRANRCHLDNDNAPQEPALAESEKADTKGFLKEILLILPLVGVRAFEQPSAVEYVSVDGSSATEGTESNDGVEDTIVVPAQEDGFRRVFLGENCWYAIRISPGKLNRIRWIAAYQTRPISAITHVAPVSRIEPYGEGGKFRVVFAEPAKEIPHIPFGDAPQASMQGTRYTSYTRLLAARKLTDLMK